MIGGRPPEQGAVSSRLLGSGRLRTCGVSSSLVAALFTAVCCCHHLGDGHQW